MRRRFGIGRRVMLRISLCLAVAAIAAERARGDKILLRGGGQIRGIVLPAASDAKPTDSVQVQTETGSRPITIKKSQIVKVVDEPSSLTEYVKKRDETPDTASAQYELGQWCEAHKLRGLADVHYERAVLKDSGYAPAHKKLGHAQYDGRWLTQDEYKQAQGLVKVKGKWVSPQEKAKREAAAALTAEQQKWTRKIRALHQTYRMGTPAQSRQAELKLLGIQEPAAVPGIVQVMGEDMDFVRILMAQILGGITDRHAAQALISRVMMEPELKVLDAMLMQAKRFEPAYYTSMLYAALQSENPVVVNRAAYALGELNITAAVPKLIPVLITYQDKLVYDNSAGSGGGGGMGFMSGGPGVGARVPPGRAGLAAQAPPSMANIPYVPIVTPVIGPGGTVAFGATSIPLTELPGVGGMGAPSQPQMRYEREIYHNVDVLNALRKLTNQNFGYEIDVWKSWLNTKYQVDKPVVRRAPEP